MGKLETSIQQITGLGITSIQVGKKNNMKVMAEEAIPVVFTFNRPFMPDETAVVQCHAYEEKFDLHHTIGTYILTMTQREQCPWIIDIDPPVRETNPIHINFPEELAGATVNLMFSLQYNPQAKWSDGIFIDFLSRKVTVEVLSSQGGPKIEAVYWCDSKGIKFGQSSSPRTTAIVKNEIIYLHIHTRGLFGKQVLCHCNATGSRLITIRDNVAVETYFFFDDTIDTIELDCYPLGNNMLELVKDKISAIPLPYIKEGELQISTKTMQVFGQPGSPRKKQYASKAKCRVDFRPSPEYDGSFGFSWYRVGDMLNSPDYDVFIRTHNRTRQKIIVNLPCNDQPFNDRDFPALGIIGKHWETTGREKQRFNVVVKDPNKSGTGPGSNVTYTSNRPTPRDNFIADINLADRQTNYTKSGYLDCCKTVERNNDRPQIVIEREKADKLRRFLLKEVYANFKNKYNKYYKIFFSADACVDNDSLGIGGFSVGEKFTICFMPFYEDTNTDDHTDLSAVHELGHSLGLPHTFDGSTSRSKYVYEEGKTDNIMDYSHLIGIKPQSLFQWQWETLNIKIKQ